MSANSRQADIKLAVSSKLLFDLFTGFSLDGIRQEVLVIVTCKLLYPQQNLITGMQQQLEMYG